MSATETRSFTSDSSAQQNRWASPVNIKVYPMAQLALVGARVCIYGDHNPRQGSVALPQQRVYRIVLLNQDCVIHKHMVSDSTICSDRACVINLSPGSQSRFHYLKPMQRLSTENPDKDWDLPRKTGLGQHLLLSGPNMLLTTCHHFQRYSTCRELRTVQERWDITDRLCMIVTPLIAQAFKCSIVTTLALDLHESKYSANYCTCGHGCRLQVLSSSHDGIPLLPLLVWVA